MTCRTCKFLDVKPHSDGVVRPRYDYIYECIAPIPEPTLPPSITRYPGWSWPPNRMYMTPNDGEDCPLYQKRSHP